MSLGEEQLKEGAIHWHSLEVEEVLERLKAHRQGGLSLAEARRRRLLDGPNRLPPALERERQIAFDAHITIVHAFGVPFQGTLKIAGVVDDSTLAYCEEERQKAVKNVKGLIRSSDVDAHRIWYAVERGHVSRVIFAQEEQLSADVIVIGKQVRSMIGEWLLGGVTRISLPVRNVTCLSSMRELRSSKSL